MLVDGTASSSANTFTAQGTGTLGGTGSIAGAVSITSTATLAPGPGDGTGFGSLTVPSLVLGGTTTSVFEINSQTGQFDQLKDLGAATLLGTLTVTDLGNGVSVGTTTFNLFNIAGVESSTFSTINLPTPPAGYMWENFGGQDFNYADGDIVLEAVPEPASMALLAMGGAVLLRRRRGMR